MRSPAMIAAFLLFAATAAAASADETPPRIEVTGTGEEMLAPDMAEVTLTVVREAGTARDALNANNSAMATVLAAMREEGIEERDLQTSGFSIVPKMVYPSGNNANEEPKIVGYTVSNSLNVRIRDLARAGAIIDRSVTLGVNQGGQIVFSHSDPSAAIDVARTRAVRDAMRKAETLARAAGGEPGKVMLISERNEAGEPVPLKRMEMALRSADAVPLAAGENTYRVMVTVVLEFRQ